MEERWHKVFEVCYLIFKLMNKKNENELIVTIVTLSIFHAPSLAVLLKQKQLLNTCVYLFTSEV